MPLLNYTTEISVARSVTQIHELLVKAGARQVVATYNDAGTPSAFAFVVQTPGGPRGFVLPVKPERVFAVMRRDAKVPPRFKTAAQAERVAWRIAKDWLEAQLALIATEMVTLDQVMLPFMRVSDSEPTTVYDLYLNRQLELLTGGEP